MKEAIELGNCNAKIVARLDPSLPITRQAIEKNALKMHCRQADKNVPISTTALFGKVLSITCMNLDCPFRKPDISVPNLSETESDVK